MKLECCSLCAASWHAAWHCLPVPPLKHLHAPSLTGEYFDQNSAGQDACAAAGADIASTGKWV